MSFFSNPKLLYFIRIGQLLLSIAFLVLICYAGTHRSWWNSINGALAVGVISSIVTFAITIHSMSAQAPHPRSYHPQVANKGPRFTHHRSNPFSGGSTKYTIARLATEVLVFLLWVASAALMLRPRGGCQWKDEVPTGRNNMFEGQQACWKYQEGREGEFIHLYDDQPIVTWTVAIVLSLIEAVTFITTVAMVWLDDRKSKVGGGTSYA
ncbi:MAG: hypothetical protein Q9178_004833 [Gyalolechia marmorata]